MQKLIDKSVKKLINIIESKPNSKKVAWQFVLEELDAGQYGNKFVQQRIRNSGIDKSIFNDAMKNSWEDVDGKDSPQQYLLLLIMGLSEKTDTEIAANVKITIVEYIMAYYKFGKYADDLNNTKIKPANKPIDLFKIIAKKEKLDPHFKHIMQKEYEPVRQVLASWAEYFEDRDNKFSYQFQTTFHSSFWELYLYQCFKELNMEVDFSKASPDFILKTSLNNNLIIEAVTSSCATGTSLNDEIKSDEEFLTYSCVRLLGAINAKHKKYLEKYSTLEYVKNKPFIVAVAPYDQPFFFIQNNEAIIRVLYGQGIIHNLWKKDEKQFIKQIFQETVDKKKDDGEIVPLELGLFTTDKYKAISAIIFSTTATISKAIVQSKFPCTVRSSRFHDLEGLIMEFVDNNEYEENHLDGLQIHHNPFAEYPLDKQEFDKYEITHYMYDVSSKEMTVAQNNYTLISRNIFGSI